MPVIIIIIISIKHVKSPIVGLGVARVPVYWCTKKKGLRGDKRKRLSMARGSLCSKPNMIFYQSVCRGRNSV